MDNYEYTELLKTLQLKMKNIAGVVEPKKIEIKLQEIKEMENDQDFGMTRQTQRSYKKKKLNWNEN